MLFLAIWVDIVTDSHVSTSIDITELICVHCLFIIISTVSVSQTCDADGMEFTLRIPEGFWGRIYTHNHYGRNPCYVRGAGGNVYTLRIPGPENYENCGTERVSKYATFVNFNF